MQICAIIIRGILVNKAMTTNVNAVICVVTCRVSNHRAVIVGMDAVRRIVVDRVAGYRAAGAENIDAAIRIAVGRVSSNRAATAGSDACEIIVGTRVARYCAAIAGRDTIVAVLHGETVLDQVVSATKVETSEVV